MRIIFFHIDIFVELIDDNLLEFIWDLNFYDFNDFSNVQTCDSCNPYIFKSYTEINEFVPYNCTYYDVSYAIGSNTNVSLESIEPICTSSIAITTNIFDIVDLQVIEILLSTYPS